MNSPERRGRLDPQNCGFDEKFAVDWVAARGPLGYTWGSGILGSRVWSHLRPHPGCTQVLGVPGTLLPGIVGLGVVKKILNLVLGPHSPLGVRGRVRTVGFLEGDLGFWADSGPDPGDYVFRFSCWPEAQLICVPGTSLGA